MKKISVQTYLGELNLSKDSQQPLVVVLLAHSYAVRKARKAALAAAREPELVRLDQLHYVLEVADRHVLNVAHVVVLLPGNVQRALGLVGVAAEGGNVLLERGIRLEDALVLRVVDVVVGEAVDPEVQPVQRVPEEVAVLAAVGVLLVALQLDVAQLEVVDVQREDAPVDAEDVDGGQPLEDPEPAQARHAVDQQPQVALRVDVPEDEVGGEAHVQQVDALVEHQQVVVDGDHLEVVVLGEPLDAVDPQQPHGERGAGAVAGHLRHDRQDVLAGHQRAHPALELEGGQQQVVAREDVEDVEVGDGADEVVRDDHAGHALVLEAPLPALVGAQVEVVDDPDGAAAAAEVASADEPVLRQRRDVAVVAVRLLDVAREWPREHVDVQAVVLRVVLLAYVPALVPEQAPLLQLVVGPGAGAGGGHLGLSVQQLLLQHLHLLLEPGQLVLKEVVPQVLVVVVLEVVVAHVVVVDFVVVPLLALLFVLLLMVVVEVQAIFDIVIGFIGLIVQKFAPFDPLQLFILLILRFSFIIQLFLLIRLLAIHFIVLFYALWLKFIIRCLLYSIDWDEFIIVYSQFDIIDQFYK